MQKCFAVKGLGGTEAGSNRSAENDSDDRDRDELVGVENEGETDEERRLTGCNHWPRKRPRFLCGGLVENRSGHVFKVKYQSQA